MNPDEAVKPDAHLRAALRHAPDADDAAPADISAQIIAAAHRSAGERPAPSVRPSAAGGRWWLQPWGASGALATVLMAGVIGLMWRGETPGPAREEVGPQQVAQAPAPAPVPTPTPTPAPATADAQATPPAPAPTPQPAATKPRVLAAAPAIKPPAKPALQPMAAEPSEAVASARDTGAAIAAAPPAPAALAAPPPAPAANLRATQRAAQEQSAAAPSNAAPPAAVARLRAAAGATTAPQSPWPTAPQPGDQFSWQPADHLLPPDAAWLARMAELSAGRWQPLSVTPSTAEVAQLHWQRSGATVARFGFDRSSVWWCGPLTACERAPLDAAALRDLLAQLAR